MTSFAFVLGNTPELSIAEIESVLASQNKSFSRQRLTNEILEISFQDDFNPTFLIEKLGGTVKIAKFEKESNSLTISDYLACFDPDTKKVDFGISSYGESIDIKKESLNLKRLLEQKDIKSRFVLPKENAISSVVVSKQKLTEILIVKEGEKFRIFKTLAVQNFEEWNFRDYQRPYVDPSSGMLPPKVARMMVNLALNGNFGTNLLDPFCGVGTILSEAMLSGFNVIGSDSSPKAIEYTRKNLEWVEKIYKTTRKFDTFIENAQNISKKLSSFSINAIVTEPYMGELAKVVNGKIYLGSNVASKDTIGKIIIDLENLYIGSLKNWTSALCQNGIVVMAFPSFNLSGLEFCVKSPIDKAGELGYTLLQGPIMYSRPQAIVKRNIYLFAKQSK